MVKFVIVFVFVLPCVDYAVVGVDYGDDYAVVGVDRYREFHGDDYATKMQIAVGVAVAIYFVILPFSLSKLQVLIVRFRV